MKVPRHFEQIEVALDSIASFPTNYNAHPDNQLSALSGGLERWGQWKNVVVWNGKILAGHGLVEAARREGFTHIVAQDWSELSEVEAEALLVADNETARMAEPDEIKLADIVRRVKDEDEALAKLAAGDDKRLEQLVRLANATEPGYIDSKEQIIKEQWLILIECESEDHQAKSLEELMSSGFKCKALIS